MPVCFTHNSLITENLYIAAENPLCTGAILSKIFNEIIKIVNKGSYMLSSFRASKLIDDKGKGAKVQSDNDQVLDEKSEHSNMGNVNNKYEPDNFHKYDVAHALADRDFNKQ